MLDHCLICLDPELDAGEVGGLVDEPVIASRHPDGMALSADQWAALRQQRQAAGRPLHWWEVAFHG